MINKERKFYITINKPEARGFTTWFQGTKEEEEKLVKKMEETFECRITSREVDSWADTSS